MPNFLSRKIIEACREPGCPLCRLEQKGVERYLDNQLYENVNSPAWRDRLRRSRGFCHEHAWLGVSQRLGDALGYSIIYHDLVNATLKTLDEGEKRAGASGSLRARAQGTQKALAVPEGCPVCAHREELRRDLLSALLEDLQTPDVTEALQASDGLCLPHLSHAVQSVKDPAAYDSLLRLARAKLEGLRGELAEFIRKNDYRVSVKDYGREGNAWLRAIGMLTGSRPGT